MIQGQSYRTFFSTYNFTASHYVYNNNGSVSATAGWISGRSDDIIISICCATKVPAGSISYRVEGKFAGSDRIASLDNGTIPTHQLVDKLIKINYPTSQIRLGIKQEHTVASLSASPTSFYGGLFLNERR